MKPETKGAVTARAQAGRLADNAQAIDQSDRPKGTGEQGWREEAGEDGKERECDQEVR